MDPTRPPHRGAIDRHVFVPHYIAVLANGMIWSQSRFYLEKYDAGINEVRIITVLAHSPGLSAKGLCDALWMNKSIVSRSIFTLIKKGLIEEKVEKKSRIYFLSETGLGLNDRIVRVSLARERRLLKGFSASDKVIVLGYLARMLDNLEGAMDQEFMKMVADGSDL
jgi:DNA-binding MarR family transcriptional regulator